MASRDMKFTPRCCGDRPKLPNIGRWICGSLPIWLALPSPMAAQAMKPDFITIQGLMPNEARGQNTRSASRPGCSDPTSASMPAAIAGLMVVLAR